MCVCCSRTQQLVNNVIGTTPVLHVSLCAGKFAELDAAEVKTVSSLENVKRE